MKRWLIAGLLYGVVAGCGSSDRMAKTITLAAPTTAYDTGLLDVLVPLFEKQTGYEVKIVVVGSGQALELGRRGDADVILSHAPDAEQQFINEGYGGKRYPIMYNDFILVGPASDPARVKGEKSIAMALAKIAESNQPLASRGDDSGTHMKEKNIWRLAELDPAGDWYLQSGTGMAPTLRMANEKNAYTLTDRGTFLSQRKNLKLELLVEGDSILHNPYAVTLVSAEKHPGINAEGAAQFAEFMNSAETKEVIAKFGVEKYGQPLFFPLK